MVCVVCEVVIVHFVVHQLSCAGCAPALIHYSSCYSVLPPAGGKPVDLDEVLGNAVSPRRIFCRALLLHHFLLSLPQQKIAWFMLVEHLPQQRSADLKLTVAFPATSDSLNQQTSNLLHTSDFVNFISFQIFR